jgi:hypothetical protein
LFFEVKVSCISVNGRTAWIAGHITKSNASTIVIGSVSYFFTTDNGRPIPDSLPVTDAVSTARINDALGQDIVFCTTQPTALPLLNPVTGDITIR